MEQETSGFDRWLGTTERVTRELSFVNALGAVSRLVDEAFGARLWFVELLGRRRSYLAGETGDEPAQSELTCIRLNGKFGLVSDAWGAISEAERAKLIVFLEKLVASRHGL
jgi:hypothetical protein